MISKSNILNRRFGRLVVLSESGRTKSGHILWECICDCGNMKYATSSALMNGGVKSCGCYNSEKVQERNVNRSTTNGMYKTRLYRIWSGMIRRCENSSCLSYPRYGGCGVSVCKEWHDFSSFLEWAIRSGYKEHLTIDRIDTSGDYCPTNCRWATYSQQNSNKRNNVNIEYNGIKKTLSEWSKELHIPKSTLWNRLFVLGWDVGNALSVKSEVIQ